MSLISPTGNRTIDALLWGVKWDAPTLTYGFPDSEDDYAGYPEFSFLGFETFSAAQIAATDSIIGAVNSFVLLDLTKAADGATAELRFAMANYADNGAGETVPVYTAFGIPPDALGFQVRSHGDMFFNTLDFNQPDKGSYAYYTIIHELGHALGLKHAHVAQNAPDNSVIFPKLPYFMNAMEYSIMSYRSYAGDMQDGLTNKQGSYAQSLMMLDIAALQHLYGADYTTNSSDTVYSWDAGTGEMFVNGVGQGAPRTNTVFLTIWDGGGTDTYDLSNYGDRTLIDLRPGFSSITSLSQLAVLDEGLGIFANGTVYNALLHEGDMRSMIENAAGGAVRDRMVGNKLDNVLTGNDGNDIMFGQGGNDTLLGGRGRDDMTGGIGRDVLSGGGGADTLEGGIGQDTLTGGGGSDRFFYLSTAEGRDKVVGFASAVGNEDSFWFLGEEFGGLAAGVLGDTLFETVAAGGSASSADTRFLFDGTQLMFDSDGSSEAAAVVIAILQQPSAAITAGDIFIF